MELLFFDVVVIVVDVVVTVNGIQATEEFVECAFFDGQYFTSPHSVAMN